MRFKSKSAYLLYAIYGFISLADAMGCFCFFRDHLPEWMTDESGKVLQKQIWTELVERLDKIQPGVVAAVIQN